MNWKEKTLTVLAACLSVYAVVAYASNSQIDNLRKGCERSNPKWESVYSFQVSAAETRRESALTEPKGSMQRQTDLEASIKYAQEAQALVDSVAEDGLSVPGHPAATNCSKAYPQPLPWPGG